MATIAGFLGIYMRALFIKWTIVPIKVTFWRCKYSQANILNMTRYYIQTGAPFVYSVKRQIMEFRQVVVCLSRGISIQTMHARKLDKSRRLNYLLVLSLVELLPLTVAFSDPLPRIHFSCLS